jgi:hypothetical protein
MTRTTPAHRNPGDPALLSSALELASRGWHVFPCTTGTKRPALRGNWQRHATTDPRRIRDWWTWRPYNIGISCGPSGLVVIDLDVPRGASTGTATGATSLAELCQRSAQAYPSRTFTVTTPSGGTHLYFRAPSATIPNSAGRLGPLIDTRAAGGYVLAPGSRVGGRAYTPANAMLPAPLPGWIARALTQPPPPQTASPLLPRNETVHPVPYALAALREETTRVAAAAEGTRNDTLNKAAFNLGQLVAEGCLSEATVATALADAAGASGLPEREAGRTIRSGMTAGARRPRAPFPRTTRLPAMPPRPQPPRGGPSPPAPRLR